MKLATIGLNHATAPLAVRERVAIAERDYAAQLQRLAAESAISEAMLLSTCNRTELYCHTHDLAALQSWFAHQLAVSPAVAQDCLYIHQDRDVVRHVMRVANGLDSMVLGESEILGQMKTAYRLAQQSGTLGSGLQRLFQYVFAASKQIRTHTQISAHPISIASVAVNLAKTIFSNLADNTVILIGAGQTSELVGHYLLAQGVKRLIILARSTAKAAQLAGRLRATAFNLTELPQILAEGDVVISATSSPLPLISKTMVERALKHRKRRPMLMIDLASPRDIEADTKALEDVYLYNLDDLQHVIASSLHKRASSANQAEVMIEAYVEYYMQRLRNLDSLKTLRALRQHGDYVREHSLQQAVAALAQGKNPRLVIEALARQLTNRLLHQPCVQLREAVEANNLELVDLARQLFLLPSE